MIDWSIYQSNWSINQPAVVNKAWSVSHLIWPIHQFCQPICNIQVVSSLTNKLTCWPSMKNLKKLRHSKLVAVLPYFLFSVILSYLLLFLLAFCCCFTCIFYKCCCLLLATVVHNITCTLFILILNWFFFAAIIFSVKVFSVTVAVW